MSISSEVKVGTHGKGLKNSSVLKALGSFLALFRNAEDPIVSRASAVRQIFKKIKKALGLKKRKKPRFLIYNRVQGEEPTPVGDCPHYLCLAAIVKDEGPYLAEWIEFHSMIGVEKFVIYDNHSTDNTLEVLQPYVDDGRVELIPWTNFLDQANHQHLAYVHALAHMTGKTRWLAFLDLDEFLYSPSREDIAAILHEKENYPALIVHLSNFGPSGHKVKPAGPVIDSYVRRLEHNRYVQLKSIVQPHLMHGVVSASRFSNVFDNISGHDENDQPVTSYEEIRYSANRLRINHYMTKSIEEFEQKNSRRYFWREKNNAQNKTEKVAAYSIGLEASVFDDDIIQYAQYMQQDGAKSPSK